MSERGGETGLGGQETGSGEETTRHTGQLPLSHRDYTVGWICALPEEQTAATVMLDNIHPNLVKPSSDMNAYTLGSLGKHNVVIACLPKGQYGTITAAKIATWMTSTFPSIRFGLLVGIGGGVPPKVSLGDIVISTPSAEYPGVVQWDLGKAEDGGRFKRTGSLNNPPTVLLTALAKLETQHSIHRPKIGQCLGEVKKRYPNLRSSYSRPDLLKITAIESSRSNSTSNEWLSISTGFWQILMTLVLHLFGWTKFQAAPGGGQARSTPKDQKTIRVHEAEEEFDQKRIHYGLIASGNQVIKDGALRDQLDESLGGSVLCIEMEAAALMNNFPCIIVRGISDHADARKNEEWQEYAAAIAAAYAKELLEVIDPIDVQDITEARHVVEALQDIASTSKSIAKTQEQQILEQKRLKLLQWLSSLNPSARHSENQKQRVPGTGAWLLNDHKFINWSSTGNFCSVLCCYGDPGAGKTIIASIVIDELEKKSAKDPSIGIGYVYCDYRDQNIQTVENIFRTILQQLIKHLPKISEDVQKFFEDQGEGISPLRLKDAKRLLHIISADFSTIYICLDAIDELGDVQSVLEFLQERHSCVRMFLTGRQHVQNIVQRHMKVTEDILVKAQQGDIEKFVEREIGGPNDAEPGAMDKALHTRILSKVVESAEGIFLLPVLQVRSVLQHLTIRDRETSLRTLPVNLGEAFLDTFSRIQQQSVARSTRAAQIIAWVHLAQASLSMDQLLCALTVKEGDSSFDHRGQPMRATLLDCCCGLVIIDSESQSIRLVHYSLEEYLGQQSAIFQVQKEEWHRRIAAICLTFLSFPPPLTTQTHHLQTKFLEFAATQWGHHLRRNGHSPADVLELAVNYLISGWRTNIDGLLHLYSDMYWSRSQKRDLEISPHHISAYFGLPEIILRLNPTGPELDKSGPQGSTPLSIASNAGFVEVVRVLIEKGASPQIQTSNKYTPLMLAAENGHISVVRLLLAHPEIDVNIQDTLNRTALQLAARRGHADVVQQLLGHPKTDVNAPDYYARNVLQSMAERGDANIIQLLLSHPQINVNSQNQNGWTALQLAAVKGNIDVVQLLLACHKVDINIQNRKGWSALHAAAWAGESDVIRLLLNHPSVKIQQKDRDGWTAFTLAKHHHHSRAAKLLCERKIEDSNTQGSNAAPNDF